MEYAALPSVWRRAALLLAAFLIPFKLSLAYAVILPLLLLWGISIWRGTVVPAGRGARLIRPALAFFCVAGLSSVMSFDPLRSVVGATTSIAVLMLIAVVSMAERRDDGVDAAAALVLGQSVAGLYSILDWLFPDALPHYFVGPVTESGQLSLVIPLLLGLAWTLFRGARRVGGSDWRFSRLQLNPARCVVWGAANVGLLWALCFAGYVPTIPIPRGAVGALLLLSAVGAVYLLLSEIRRGAPRAQLLFFFCITVALPITTTTLLVNLKRGPWAGVFVASLIFLFTVRRWLIVPVLATAVVLFTTVEPLRARIEASHDHFFISGGRSEIWDIGMELITTYPLGIGYRNSPVLRDFSSTVPPQLRHFHSNPINIAVECGMLGLCLYLWWLAAIVRASRIDPDDGVYTPLIRACGFAVISWQIAGLVEYNVGDSEVVLLAYVVLGILARLSAKESETKVADPGS